MPVVRLSIAICTYNRADSLARTLQSFTEAKPIPAGEWELIVIDNCSTDATHAVAESFADRLPMRYDFEPQQGLSNARNRVIAVSCGGLVVFTDDDILIGDSWLRAYHATLDNWLGADYFGGPIAPLFPEGKPAWLRDERMPLISGLIGHYDLGPESRPYAERDMHPFGANFGLRRRLIDAVGPFDVELGVKGQAPGRAEEAEYFSRARGLGFAGRYLADARCGHCVQSSHLRLRYLYRYGIHKGLAAARMGERSTRERRGVLAEGWQLLRGCAQLLKGRPDRWRQSVINAGILRGVSHAAVNPGFDEEPLPEKQESVGLSASDEN